MRLSRLTLALVALSGVACLAALNLPWPFSGDQALFNLGARHVFGGDVLYRDFWDLKQPGIYWFYLTAGAAFGFTEVGVHSLELIYFVAFAGAVLVATRRYFRSAFGPAAAALLGAGVYLIVADSWHLTQIEALVGPPIFLAVWSIARVDAAPRRWAARSLFAGVMCGVVAVFKLVLVVIPAAVFLATLADLLWRRDTRLALVVACSGAAGFVLCVAPVAAFFAWLGQLDEITRTFFVYPARIRQEIGHNDTRVLFDGATWFWRAAWPMTPFAVVALVTRLRRRDDGFSRGLAVWLVVAAVAVLAQQMWWEYHFVLLLMPLGLLAAAGLEDVWVWLSRRVGWFAVGVVVFAIPYVDRAWDKSQRLRDDGAASLTVPPIEAGHYGRAVRATAFLAEPGALPGPVYVLGDPVMYHVSGRRQAVGLNGWSPELFLADQWVQLVGQLRAARPAYVYVDRVNNWLLADRGSALMELLSVDYERLSADTEGIWYVRR